MTLRRFLQLNFYELHRIFPHFKLWRICKALEIKPRPWQRDFALGKIDALPPEILYSRATGKTLAVMLRLLMVHPFEPFDRNGILTTDPDYVPTDYRRRGWYEIQYRRLAMICYKANIPVNMMVDAWQTPKRRK